MIQVQHAMCRQMNDAILGQPWTHHRRAASLEIQGAKTLICGNGLENLLCLTKREHEPCYFGLGFNPNVSKSSAHHGRLIPVIHTTGSDYLRSGVFYKGLLPARLSGF